MKEIEYFYEGLYPLSNLTKICEADDILYFDIETTGLSRKNNNIYLIGIGHYINNGLKIVQWFSEDASEEPKILKSFIDYASSFTCLVNYNGKSFDIPFTAERIAKYDLKMPELDSIDLYTYTKPLKKILSLSDLTQKSIESFLNIKRNDIYNGGELISVYKKYVSLNSNLSNTKSDVYNKLVINTPHDLSTQAADKSSYVNGNGLSNIKIANCINDILIYDSNELIDDFNKLILHNEEDVLNMHYLVDILFYSDLNKALITYTEHSTNQYTDYSGNSKSELLLSGLHNLSILPRGFNSFKNDCLYSYMMSFNNDGTLRIRVPIFEGTLYYYIDNYKDYYYLPAEDICILKSMAGGVLKESRENAKKENCRIKLCDKFIPLPTVKEHISFSLRTFKDSSKSKLEYIRLTDFEVVSAEEKSALMQLFYNYYFI